MKKLIKSAAKKILPKSITNEIKAIINARSDRTPIAKRHCNICGYEGFFKGFGRPTRLDACCPKCGSLERHRLLMLGVERGSILNFDNKNAAVLHFAPEPILEKIFRDRFSDYCTADLFAESDIKLNIEDIDLGDEKYDIVIANHVLEHVDDRKASRELSRILKKNGILICQVPIIEGWDKTYENDNICTDLERWVHFGKDDHIRFYGKDFRDRISESGFNLFQEITAEGVDVVNNGLLRGEKVFVFQKASN
ncbi:class I SAM-dependent methyltransferase [Halopseudomonas salegens]|uniref:Methyltransferase domain-containing protein n=1 Tax=Halopseudomonas salegens TaxID=1434072 RepID=A0A1H2FM38_9GAMM|nr:class I SAM-dependent methyltransferase [Halopseudomonas salegens]SDU08403.1 Methyltransferase domain-containing protein [Halopseudomonas salegens]